MFRRKTSKLVGISVFGVPTSEQVMRKRARVPSREGVVLSRFLLLDEV
jgi:hypothetical protein